MKKNKTKNSELNFKISSIKKNEIPPQYCSLTPERYLQFIECGVSLNPDYKSYIENKKDYKAEIRFKL